MLNLFKRNPINSKLISDKQLLNLAQKVVRRYVTNGSIPLKEMEDIQMGIVERFLLKHDHIKKAYIGKANVTTYCVAVLNKMCCEHIRKEVKQWKQQPTEHMELGQTSHTNTMTRLVIDDESRLLKKIICLFGHERYKVRLFMAYFYQLVIAELDIQYYDKNYIKNNLKELFEKIDLKNKGEIYKILSMAVQRAEQKELKPDAVRAWLNKTIDKVVVRLNGPFNRAYYDKDSTQILFEFYYTKHIAEGKEHFKEEA